jgi:hypothetical protein
MHPHILPGIGGCNCCNLSRRCFLSTSLGAAAAAAAPLAAAAAPAPIITATPEDLAKPIDLKSLRPHPKVRVVAATARLKPPYWLGWPGTSYDLEGHRKQYETAFQEAGKRVGVDVSVDPTPIESPEELTPWIAKIKAQKPDAIVLQIQHIHVWRWLEPIASIGAPVIIWAPVGVAFTGQINQFRKTPGVHVLSTLDTRSLDQALRMVRAKRQLEETRLLVLKGNERKESVLEGLGTKVRYIPRDTLHLMFEKMPLTEEAREIAKTAAKGADKVVEPSEQDLHNAARSFLTARRLLRDEQSNAITSDCLGMVTARVMPTPPCMAVSMFQDHGVTYGCEADVFGAMSLMLSSYLLDKPGFMNDPVPETFHNTLIAAHCVCGTKINGFDQPPVHHILRSHSESSIGVALQVLWKEGARATLVRFQKPGELILDTGTVVGNIDTPPAGGCRTSVELQMDRIEDSRDVLGFHQVVLAGDHRRDVEAFCQLYGIKVTNSPAASTTRAA